MIYVTHIHRFHFDDRLGTLIDFIPVRDVPGFHYRIILNGKPTDWLPDTMRPTLRSARDFYALWIAQEAREAKVDA